MKPQPVRTPGISQYNQSVSGDLNPAGEVDKDIECLFDSIPLNAKNGTENKEIYKTKSIGDSIYHIFERLKNKLSAARDYILSKIFEQPSREAMVINVKHAPVLSSASTNFPQPNNKNHADANLQVSEGDQNFVTASNVNVGMSPDLGAMRSNSTEVDVEEGNDQIKYDAKKGCIEFTEWFSDLKSNKNSLIFKIPENFSDDAFNYAKNFIEKNESSDSNSRGKAVNNMLLAAKFLVLEVRDKKFNVLDNEILPISTDLEISSQDTSGYIVNFGRTPGKSASEISRAMDINHNVNYFLDIVFIDKSKNKNSSKFKNIENSENFKQLKSDTQVFFAWRQLWAEVRVGVHEAAISYEANSLSAISPEELNIRNANKSNQVQLEKTDRVQKFSDKYSASEAELLACDRFIEQYRLLITKGTDEQKAGCGDLELNEYVEDYIQFYNRSEKNLGDNKKSPDTEKKESGVDNSPAMPESWPPAQVASTKPAISLATNTAIIAEVSLNPSQLSSPNRPESMGMVSDKNVTDANKIATPAVKPQNFPELDVIDYVTLQTFLAASSPTRIMNAGEFNAMVKQSSNYFNAIEKGIEFDLLSKANAMQLAQRWKEATSSPKTRTGLAALSHFKVLNELLNVEKIRSDFR